MFENSLLDFEKEFTEKQNENQTLSLIRYSMGLNMIKNSNGQMTDRPRGPKTSDRPSPKSNKSNKFFIGLLL